MISSFTEYLKAVNHPLDPILSFICFSFSIWSYSVHFTQFLHLYRMSHPSLRIDIFSLFFFCFSFFVWSCLARFTEFLHLYRMSRSNYPSHPLLSRSFSLSLSLSSHLHVLFTESLAATLPLYPSLSTSLFLPVPVLFFSHCQSNPLTSSSRVCLATNGNAWLAEQRGNSRFHCRLNEPRMLIEISRPLKFLASLRRLSSPQADERNERSERPERKRTRQRDEERETRRASCFNYPSPSLSASH